MEVGAVKHHLNNEIIHIKKKLNQAKVQLIHKLTRKAATLKKKSSEHLKEKLQRKADSAVAEVLLLKKVQAKDLVRFAIAHKGKLQDYLNKPTVDNEKVFAKILLHKALTEKYNGLRERFANMPVDELLMTRKERLRLKKENNDKKANKGKGKEGMEKLRKKRHGKAVSQDVQREDMKEEDSDSINEEDEKQDRTSEEHFSDEPEDGSDVEHTTSDEDEPETQDAIAEPNTSDFEGDSNSDSDLKSTNKLKDSKIKQKAKTTRTVPEQQTQKKEIKTKHKSKKSNKKPNSKQRNRDSTESTPVQAKVVDSFFLTTSGDQYMTLAEPREPDQVKEEHHRGNRKLRRAEMFGKPIKSFRSKPNRSRDLRNGSSFGANSKYEKPLFSRGDTTKNDSFNAKPKPMKEDFISLKGVRSKSSDDTHIDKRKTDVAAEKLHPSWEAKKQKSGIVAFQGKKVVF